ncbi:hypothetical protein XENOCAPTIV_025783, partial [Xenoophorus captivus]
LSAMQHSAPSWAGMSTGGFSVLARSTICTWPECVPGNASRELLLSSQIITRTSQQVKLHESNACLTSEKKDIKELCDTT